MNVVAHLNQTNLSLRHKTVKSVHLKHNQESKNKSSTTSMKTEYRCVAQVAKQATNA